MADARGTAYLERLTVLIGLYGEPITLVRSGVDKPIVAVTTPTDGGSGGTFYDANEAVGLLRPALTLYVAAGGEVPTPNDVFFRDGRLFTVRKTHVYRVCDVAVVLLAVTD